MLKKLILLEGEEDYQCDTLEELVKRLLDEKYYELSYKEKRNAIKKKALANCLGINMNVIENFRLESDIENNIIIYDEITYIYSLLILNKVLLLERIDSNIFTKKIDKSKMENNYIIVNKFAKELLENYINELDLS